MKTPYVIGLIGLGTMGANLARNAARSGASVAVFNRTPEKTDAFMQAYGSEGAFVASKTLSELIRTIPRPRSIVIMVNAGAAVDAVIQELLPMLEEGDTIIDAGNSHFLDTDRRIELSKARGVHFLGMGVSGGEEGALKGPSMMPGGSREAYDRIAPLLTRMAAKDGSGGRCISFVGSGGSGHFVKMVHNGIEYGDMQLIAEAYHLLKASGHSNADIADTFTRWNSTRDLKSFLIEITAQIFRTTDDLTPSDLIDVVRDEAKQKGTGAWTTKAALDLGIAVPTITAAVDARIHSSAQPLRRDMHSTAGAIGMKTLKLSPARIKKALTLSKICSYAQGFSLIAEASRVYGWNIDVSEVCRIWKGGCIIRSALLSSFQAAFQATPPVSHLLLAPAVLELFKKHEHAWRSVVAKGILAGIPLPAMESALSSFDTLRAAWLPQCLTQAQRDAFGSHTYERTDRPGTFHSSWRGVKSPA